MFFLSDTNNTIHTLIVLIVRVLEAAPHVADHALHAFHLHSTVGHVHFTSRDSFSGCSVHSCGRPAQLGLLTVITVSTKGEQKRKLLSKCLCKTLNKGLVRCIMGLMYFKSSHFAMETAYLSVSTLVF